MKRILFSETFFATDASGNSKPQFEKGQHYPADDAEAQRCIARGIAKEVDVADEPAPEAPAVDAAADAKPAKAKK